MTTYVIAILPALLALLMVFSGRRWGRRGLGFAMAGVLVGCVVLAASWRVYMTTVWTDGNPASEPQLFPQMLVLTTFMFLPAAALPGGVVLLLPTTAAWKQVVGAVPMAYVGMVVGFAVVVGGGIVNWVG